MKQKILYLSWLICFVSTLGSLYFSNFMQLPPCSLCWWQRIAMFPLVFLFAAGYLLKDKNCFYYTTPLILAGFITAFYHNLLYYGLIEKSITACSAGLSCTSKQIELMGFITIPLLSLLSFTVLLALTIYAFLNNRKTI